MADSMGAGVLSGDAKAPALPVIIQGGLGVGVSNWRLARAVSKTGQLGVISGTALDQVLVRRLQDGDPEGHMAYALKHFPDQEMAARVWQRYYVAGGKAPDKAYALPPMQTLRPGREYCEIVVVANFCEVFLSQQEHSNPVGVNYMEKLQPPHLASIFGAMLAGVDYVLMGAGIPMKIPAVLDHYANYEAATYPLTVTGATAEDDTLMRFDPAEFMPGYARKLKRPQFLPIVASAVLAITLAKKASGRVDGFIIEGPTAGGHNAPPRGQLQLNDAGEPIYGERDQVALAKFRSLGMPFWLAGGYGSSEALKAALAEGATGIQVGTAFALCDESGMEEVTKRAVMQRVIDGRVRVFTDRLASPTGFPFKVADVQGSVSDREVFLSRPRVCDLGYLREAYREDDGTVAFRCPGEAIPVFVKKGGEAAEAENRKCICNALLAAIGHSQVRGAYVEPPVVTAGDDLTGVGRFLDAGAHSFSAADVVRKLMAGVDLPARP